MHFSRPLHSIYKIGLILLFKPILQIYKYIVIHIYILYIVYFYRYIVISEAIYIIKIYISVLHCHYFSIITSSLFVQSARGPKIKRRMLGYWIQLFCLPKACHSYPNASYHILQRHRDPIAYIIGNFYQQELVYCGYKFQYILYNIDSIV